MGLTGFRQAGGGYRAGSREGSRTADKQQGEAGENPLRIADANKRGLQAGVPAATSGLFRRFFLIE